jgi:hypothetical protein
MFDIKDMVISVRHTCMSQSNDEYYCCCIEPPSPLNVCEEIVGNSATNEPTLIEICNKLLNANMSQEWD